MKKQSRLILQSLRQRRGATAVLIAAMMIVFLVAAAVTVDFAYMQLIRTELRTATDAAAKAGAEALARTQDANAARAAAVAYAAANPVGGRPYAINTSDVTLGRVTNQQNGTWQFAANSTPYNAVRINARVGNGGTTAAKGLFFAGALGHGAFSTQLQGTAAQQEVEVCVCLDRSGSMMFDMSGNTWAYPSPNSLLYPSHHYPDTFYRNYCSPPHASLSRWAVLMSAVNSFLNEAGQFQYPPRTSLVTWSNAMTLPYYPNRSYTESTSNVALPAAGSFNWSTNRSQVESQLATLTANPLGGGTNLAAGMDRAIGELTGANSRALSKKIMILMTDGEWNAGRDPLLAAQDAANAGITIHTISMLTSTQSTLTNIAQMTGGNYYPTDNAAELEQAFEDIARSLPIVLTD